MKRFSLLFIVVILTGFCALSDKIYDYADQKTNYVEKVESIQFLGYDTGLTRVSYEEPPHWKFWRGVQEITSYIDYYDILTIMTYIDIAVFFLVMLSIFILPPKVLKENKR